MLKKLEARLPNDDEILSLVPIIRDTTKFVINDEGVVYIISDYDKPLHNFFRKFKKNIPEHRNDYLDAYGSFVWKQIDGQTSVAEIIERFKFEFDEESEIHHEERVILFLDWLAADYIDLYNEQKEGK